MTATDKTPLEVLERLAKEVPDNDITSPDWGDCFQSWRAYIPKEVRPLWASLSRESRLLCVILGERSVAMEQID